MPNVGKDVEKTELSNVADGSVNGRCGPFGEPFIIQLKVDLPQDLASPLWCLPKRNGNPGL